MLALLLGTKIGCAFVDARKQRLLQILRAPRPVKQTSLKAVLLEKLAVLMIIHVACCVNAMSAPLSGTKIGCAFVDARKQRLLQILPTPRPVKQTSLTAILLVKLAALMLIHATCCVNAMLALLLGTKIGCAFVDARKQRLLQILRAPRPVKQTSLKAVLLEKLAVLMIIHVACCVNAMSAPLSGTKIGCAFVDARKQRLLQILPTPRPVKQTSLTAILLVKLAALMLIHATCCVNAMLALLLGTKIGCAFVDARKQRHLQILPTPRPVKQTSLRAILLVKLAVLMLIHATCCVNAMLALLLGKKIGCAFVDARKRRLLQILRAPRPVKQTSLKAVLLEKLTVLMIIHVACCERDVGSAIRDKNRVCICWCAKTTTFAHFANAPHGETDLSLRAVLVEKLAALMVNPCSNVVC